ncbi:MAG: hypothetical protein U5K75_05580 [Ahrensia sp.]|nr:hypothetical protein [Ahrensia sp.]
MGEEKAAELRALLTTHTAENAIDFKPKKRLVRHMPDKVLRYMANTLSAKANKKNRRMMALLLRATYITGIRPGEWTNTTRDQFKLTVKK